MKKIFAIIITLVWLVCGRSENYNRNSTSVYENVKNKLNSVADDCEVSETCVRFCCDEKSDCLDENFFNLSSLFEAKYLNSDYKVLIGRPSCGSMYEEDNGIWKFLNDGKVMQTFDEKQFINDHNQYCFDKKDEENRMLICHGDDDEESESEVPSEKTYPICKNLKQIHL